MSAVTLPLMLANEAALASDPDIGDATIIQVIQMNGADFLVTPDVEQQLSAVGYSSAVIAALKSNYRPASSPLGATTLMPILLVGVVLLLVLRD